MNTMDKNMIDFFEKCREEAKAEHDVSYETGEIITEEYALVQEIAEMGDEMYIQILATGDLEGMSWLYDKACDHFDEYKGGVMKMEDFQEYGEKVEFH
jgi:hypothetical protein